MSKVKNSSTSIADMVKNAIQNLSESNGSSLQAIKKYIAATYNVDIDKYRPFIKEYVLSATSAGTLIQMTGRGASGSFKLANGNAESSKGKIKSKSSAFEKNLKTLMESEGSTADTGLLVAKKAFRPMNHDVKSAVRTKSDVMMVKKKTKVETADKKMSKPKTQTADKKGPKQKVGVNKKTASKTTKGQKAKVIEIKLNY